MNGFHINIEKATEENEYFRKVLYTDPRLQLVVMCLQPHEEIGLETHKLDQFIRIESGQGLAILNGEQTSIGDGSVVIVPQGTEHNIINTGDGMLKLYTVYTPPEHKDGTIHKTKEEALADEQDHYE